MKNALFILFTLTLLSSCKTIVGDGNITTQNYGSFNNYQTIVVGKMISVSMAAATAGNEKSVTISTDQNIHEYIKVYEEDNKLYISVRKGYSLETDNLEVQLFTPQDLFVVNNNFAKINIDGLEYINCNLKNKGSGAINIEAHDADVEVEQSGSGSINVNGTMNKPVYAKNSGSGHVNIEGDLMDEVSLDNSGSGNITVKGSSNGLSVKNTGSGKVTSLSSPTDHASIDNKGSGSCHVNVINVLTVRISGSGNIYYKGNPSDITKDVSGPGKLIKL